MTDDARAALSSNRDDARARLLASVSDALRGAVRTAAPQPYQPPGSDAGPHELIARYCAEVTALGGSATVVADIPSAAAALEEHLRGRDLRSVAVHASKLATEVGALLDGFEVTMASQLDKPALAHVDCSLLQAETLVAESGAALLLLHDPMDRCLPYLPRTCAIVAGASSVCATLGPQALAPLWRAAREGARGEAVLVAGPSRTADIEKVLVFGAHGPASVVVYIIQNL